MWPIHKAREPDPGVASGDPILQSAIHTLELHRKNRSSGTSLGFANTQTRLICAHSDTEQTLADKTAKAQSQMNSHLRTLHRLQLLVS